MHEVPQNFCLYSASYFLCLYLAADKQVLMLEQLIPEKCDNF